MVAGRAPVPIILPLLESWVLAYVINATSHLPARIAATAWLRCASNEDPPIDVVSVYRGNTCKYSHSMTVGMPSECELQKTASISFLRRPLSSSARHSACA